MRGADLLVLLIADHEQRRALAGRERDTPLVPHAIYVDRTNGTNYEDGTAAHPSNTVGEDKFASQDGDDIVVRTGTLCKTLSFVRKAATSMRASR